MTNTTLKIAQLQNEEMSERVACGEGEDDFVEVLIL